MNQLVDGLFELALRLVETRTPRVIALDELGELVGDRKISSAEIDLLIGRLEEDDVVVGGDAGVDLTALLRKVIQNALLLKKAGKPANPLAIAQQAGLSLGAVKLALLYSEVIQRPN